MSEIRRNFGHCSSLYNCDCVVSVKLGGTDALTEIFYEFRQLPTSDVWFGFPKCATGRASLRPRRGAGVRHGWFPKPVRLSPGCVAWLESDLETWIDGRLEARDDTKAAVQQTEPNTRHPAA